MQFDNLTIHETSRGKICTSSDYNYIFDKTNGNFIRWGKTIADNPLSGPSPEIADIEITTKCEGVGGIPCPFCYKSNTPNGVNMPFETFKKIFDKLPKGLTQIAFGADSHATSNPDLFKMMDYCRESGIIPNITVAEITDKIADQLVKYCGAVAVSRYADKNICYNSIKKLVDKGLQQCNIHIMISEETYDMVWETFEDRLTDPRLEKLKAIVLLSLKKKGRGEKFTPLSLEKFKKIVNFALDNNIGIGFDSCSAYKFLSCVKDKKEYERYEQCSESCESSLFSVYINSDGFFFPCSFAEGTGEWKQGIDVANCNDFVKDIWDHPRTISFRKNLLKTSKENSLGCRECPLFEI